jgi:hypothetical protein
MSKSKVFVSFFHLQPKTVQYRGLTVRMNIIIAAVNVVIFFLPKNQRRREYELDRELVNSKINLILHWTLDAHDNNNSCINGGYSAAN